MRRASPPNLLWVLLDAMRARVTGADQLDRLSALDELAKEMIELRYAVTSAPSTIMSIAAMMTSTPAYQIARTYDDFRFDTSRFPSFPAELHARGYFVRQVSWYPYGRLRFRDLLPQAERRYWPRSASGGEHWTNRQVAECFANLVGSGIPDPFFSFVHLDARKPDAEAALLDALEVFRSRSPRDRSIVIICPDHGMPDPRRLATSAAAEATHDMIMDADNLLVPVLLAFPGATPRLLSARVSTLDLAPTLLELLGIAPSDPMIASSTGRSLADFVRSGRLAPELGERFHRADNRFFFQAGRVTALIRGAWKYLYYHESGREALHRLDLDPDERSDLANNAGTRALLAEFRDAYRRSRLALEQHHLEFLVAQLKRRGLGRSRGRVLLLDVSGWSRPDALAAALDRGIGRSRYDVVSSSEEWRSLANRGVRLIEADPLDWVAQRERCRAYETIILFGTGQPAIELRKRIRLRRRVLILDSNMDVVRPVRWRAIRSVARARLSFYVAEPGAILRDVARLARLARGGRA